MKRLNDKLARGVGPSGPALPAVRRRGLGGAAARPAHASVAVPGVGGHGAGAAQRHAQPRHDHRARRAELARCADGIAAAGVRAVSCPHRLPLRYAPFAPGLAARPLHLVRQHVCSSAALPSCRSRSSSCRAMPTVPRGSAMRPRRWRSSSSAPACIRPRPPAWRSPPIWRPQESRPRVVAFLYVMLLVGMVASALVFGAVLSNFSQLRLIQLIQGAAVVTMLLNMVALWKQEARNPALTSPDVEHPSFRDSWQRIPHRRPLEPRSCRRRLRSGGLQHAGHPARALWRRSAEARCRRHHNAHGVAGIGNVARVCARRPRSEPRRRSLPAWQATERLPASWHSRPSFFRCPWIRRCCSASAPL